MENEDLKAKLDAFVYDTFQDAIDQFATDTLLYGPLFFAVNFTKDNRTRVSWELSDSCLGPALSRVFYYPLMG